MIEVSGKQIASNKITIRECFDRDMWYKIPDYQRPYVWGEDQITLLLDDVLYATSNTPDTEYFLGSLVLHSKTVNKNGSSYIENSVLDGQQRLITLYLMYAVIRDITKDNDSETVCKGAIYQKGNEINGTPERLRIEFEIRDDVENFIDKFIKREKGTLRKEELTELSKKSKNISIKNMATAILILHKWFGENDEKITRLLRYFQQKVILIYVASAELEDAFRLFTVLNDRGIKLRSSDILKAQNLKEVSDTKKQKEYAKFWERLEGELEEDFDLFLSHIRTILVKEKARYDLLKEFEDNIYKKHLLEKGKETFELLKSYKEHYDTIFSGNNYDLNNNWAFDNLISILKDTSLSDIWIPPLLMYLKVFGKNNINDFLIKLDNKFSADWIARETPTVRFQAMAKIIEEIERCNNDSSLPTKNEKINSLLKSDSFKFKFNDFIYQIKSSDVYGKGFARYLLRKIDYLLDKPSYTERRNSYKNMSIEHILPQNPKENSQWLKDFTNEQREEWANKLGNLVLISRIKNASQGRLDFMDKKSKYFDKNIETFPNSLKVLKENEWNIFSLEKNHKSLIKLLEEHYQND